MCVCVFNMCIYIYICIFVKTSGLPLYLVSQWKKGQGIISKLLTDMDQNLVDGCRWSSSGE